MTLKKNPLSILFTCLMLTAVVAGTNYVWAASISKPEIDDKPLYLERPADTKRKNVKMLQKSQFLIAYNTDKRCSDYVCWFLTAARVKGKVQRTNNFHADSTLAANLRVESFDYNGSRYDRGHMCPAGDNKNTLKAMNESFCMTNMCPQNHQLNTGLWNDLEVQCRSWARNYSGVYICCGPIYDSKSSRTVGRRKNMRIAVPDRFFKVVLMMGAEPKAIGFIFPNSACQGDMRDYAKSVDEVEKATGLDFFCRLNDKLERQVESECKPGAWGI